MTAWRITDRTDPGAEAVDVAPGDGDELEPALDGTARLRALEHPPATVLVLPLGRDGSAEVIEVVVDGWRFELAVENAARAALRERATRAHADAAGGGPLQVRAVIPGRVVSVAVAPGDGVSAGEPLLVIEAMKMQNELRAPRDGTVDRVAVDAGTTVERGDLLLVLT